MKRPLTLRRGSPNEKAAGSMTSGLPGCVGDSDLRRWLRSSPMSHCCLPAPLDSGAKLADSRRLVQNKEAASSAGGQIGSRRVWTESAGVCSTRRNTKAELIRLRSREPKPRRWPRARLDRKSSNLSRKPRHPFPAFPPSYRTSAT